MEKIEPLGLGYTPGDLTDKINEIIASNNALWVNVNGLWDSLDILDACVEVVGQDRCCQVDTSETNEVVAEITRRSSTVMLAALSRLEAIMASGASHEALTAIDLYLDLVLGEDQ